MFSNTKRATKGKKHLLPEVPVATAQRAASYFAIVLQIFSPLDINSPHIPPSECLFSYVLTGNKEEGNSASEM